MNNDSRHHINAALTPIVQRLLHDTSATITRWSEQTLGDGLSGFAVSRFQGQAESRQGTQAWSVIRKVLTPDHGGKEATDWNYWQREALVYRTAILQHLPRTLVAPTCFALTDSVLTVESTERCELWLEDMGSSDASTWSLERYGLAARHLGEWNGQFLVGQPVPTEPWWRGEDLDQRLAQGATGIAELPTLRDHPEFAEMLANDRIERIQALWAVRNQLRAALEQLPRTLCHRDAGPRNLMSRRGDDGNVATVALDWGMAGRGILGEEIVPLFAATLTFVAMPAAQIPRLDQIIFTNYIAGLRAAGWQGDERLVRFGFAALAALKVGVADPAFKLPRVARRIAALPPDVEPPRLLNPGGYAQEAALGQYLLDLGNEALQLQQKYW